MNLGKSILIILMTYTFLGKADYACVCNYNPWVKVYPQPDNSTKPIGYLYEYDCKPGYKPTIPDWTTIQFEKKVGYIQVNESTKLQTCPGMLPNGDLVTSTSHGQTGQSTTGLATSINITEQSTVHRNPCMSTAGYTYPCVCNFNELTSVHSQPDNATKPIGYLNGFICKPFYKPTISHWMAIQFEKKVGYIQVNEYIQLQMCPGVMPSGDLVPTPPTTSTVSPLPRLQIGESDTGLTISVNIIEQSIVHRNSYTYPCVCIYNSQTSVHPQPENATKPIGYLYEFDCKPFYKPTISQWMAIQFEKKVGYIQVNEYIKLQMCPGVMPSGDSGPIPPTTSAVTPSTRVQTRQSPTGLSTSINMRPAGKLYLCSFLVKDGTEKQYMAQHGNYCYELYPYLSKDWFTAETYCRYHNGSLAVVSSREIQDIVEYLLDSARFHRSVWIGLHDLRTEGQWEWTDGMVLTSGSFENWRPYHHDPVYAEEQDCVLLDGRTGKWKDVVCDGFLLDIQRHPWVCQYHIPRLP